jgi:hypothetical protein
MNDQTHASALMLLLPSLHVLSLLALPSLYVILLPSLSIAPPFSHCCSFPLLIAESLLPSFDIAPAFLEVQKYRHEKNISRCSVARECDKTIVLQDSCTKAGGKM